MMMQLVDCTIDTSQFLSRERDECLLDARRYRSLIRRSVNKVIGQLIRSINKVAVTSL